MLNQGLESTSTGKARYRRGAAAYLRLLGGCQISLLSNDSEGTFWRQSQKPAPSALGSLPASAAVVPSDALGLDHMHPSPAPSPQSLLPIEHQFLPLLFPQA